MASNALLVKKATIAVSDLSTNGGYLNPEQNAEFIRTLRVSPTILRVARSVIMRSHTKKIPKIQFETSILKPGVSGTALSSGDRSKPTTDEVVITTDELVAEVDIPYDVMEDNIEGGEIGTHREGGSPAAGGGITDTILAIMADRAAEDLENMAINAIDAGSNPDPLLNVMDGYLDILGSASNIVDGQADPITKTLFKNGVKTMPDQYLRNRARLRNFVSMDQDTEFRDTYADRMTPVGDSNLQGLPAIYAFGVAIEPVSYMPEDKGMLVDPMNLIWGIHRDIHIEMDKEIRERILVIVMSMRVGLQIEETNAAVLYSNVGTP